VEQMILKREAEMEYSEEGKCQVWKSRKATW